MCLLIFSVWVYGWHWLVGAVFVVVLVLWFDVFDVVAGLLVKINSVGVLYSLILLVVLVYCYIGVGC